jgi:NitT/TauT family transport system substrate-binding protein
MWNRLTSVAKFLIILFLVGGISAGLYFGGVLKPSEKKAKSKTESSTPKKGGGIGSLFNDNDELTVVVNTWGGYVPLAFLNEGSLEPNSESRMSKEFGIDLTVKICDVFSDSRDLFKSGECDVVYCTADVFPTEMGAGSAMASMNAKIFGQVDWSRGGDMIVVLNNIKTVADLKGKDIAVAEGTASHSLLIKVLETNGLTVNDVHLIKVSDGIEAAKLFKAGTVPAAVVWTPDGEDIVEGEFKGKAKILTSTDKAPYIIADCLVASEETLESKKDALVKFMTAWLTVNGELNNASDVEKLNAATAFAKMFFDSDKESDIGFGLNGLNKVRLTTLGDNQNFFGYNYQYTGVTGEQLYNRMSIIYSGLNLANKPLAWRTVSTTSIIDAIKISSTGQDAEPSIKFTAPTKEIKAKAAISSKKVSINFETGSYLLSDDAKVAIDQEFAGLAKDFAGFRVRVEGNTDAVGGAQMNLELSFKRAQAVVNYLVKEYQFDPNRFIVQGNGSKQAINDGVLSANENYRRTDFQFVEE